MNNLPRKFSTSGDWWLRADQVFCGDVLSSDKSLRILDGKVSQIADRQNVPADANILDVAGCIAPGFFDIQINGGGGVLLNAEPSEASIKSIARAHRQFGTTSFLPTIITDIPEVLERAVDAVIGTAGTHGVVGLHIEGPHIDASRRGTHAAEFIRRLDQQTIDQITLLRERDIPVLMTVAPASVSPRQVSELVEMGAVISIGHSNASGDETAALLDAGANAFTHLFNAMSPMLNRAPGVTGTAINSQAYCSFICDGIHVNDEMLALAIRARPIADRMIMISDAMPTVGGPDSFVLYGKTLHLRNGSLVNSEGSLAGAHTTMAESLERVVNKLGVALEEALRMAISNPARLMGVGASMTLQGAMVQDLVLISPKLECEPLCGEPLAISQ